MTKDEALRLALKALETLHDENMDYLTRNKLGGENNQCMVFAREAIKAIKAALEAKDEPWEKFCDSNCVWTDHHPDCKLAKQEPVAWVSVKDELPKAVRGVSYKSSLTDTVLVLHSDRPDYPITAHAVVGEGLGAGIAIPTDGASEHPEIAWYSASCSLNNPFNLKNDDYERFLPKIFGKKITHWMPIPTTPPQRKPLTDEEIASIYMNHTDRPMHAQWDFARAIEAAHGITGENT
jgi:hypothetical protein